MSIHRIVVDMRNSPLLMLKPRSRKEGGARWDVLSLGCLELVWRTVVEGVHAVHELLEFVLLRLRMFSSQRSRDVLYLIKHGSNGTISLVHSPRKVFSWTALLSGALGLARRRKKKIEEEMWSNYVYPSVDSSFVDESLCRRVSIPPVASRERNSRTVWPVYFRLLEIHRRRWWWCFVECRFHEQEDSMNL